MGIVSDLTALASKAGAVEEAISGLFADRAQVARALGLKDDPDRLKPRQGVAVTLTAREVRQGLDALVFIEANRQTSFLAIDATPKDVERVAEAIHAEMRAGSSALAIAEAAIRALSVPA